MSVEPVFVPETEGLRGPEPTETKSVPTPPGAGRSTTDYVLPAVVVGVLLIAGWYLLSYVVLAPDKRLLLPAPHVVIVKGFIRDDIWKDQLDALWQTTKVATVGLGIAAVLGVAIAVVMSQARFLENAFFPYLVMLQAVPILAIVPLIQFWFGTDWQARVLVCVLISIFPIILNTLFGLQSADRGLHDLFTLHRASRWTRLTKLMFPASLPALFAGLRISAGLSVVGAIVGDFFFGKGTPGLGQDLKKYSSLVKPGELFGAMLLSCALGVVVFLIFGWLQRVFTARWYDGNAR